MICTTFLPRSGGKYKIIVQISEFLKSIWYCIIFKIQNYGPNWWNFAILMVLYAFTEIWGKYAKSSTKLVNFRNPCSTIILTKILGPNTIMVQIGEFFSSLHYDFFYWDLGANKKLSSNLVNFWKPYRMNNFYQDLGAKYHLRPNLWFFLSTQYYFFLYQDLGANINSSSKYVNFWNPKGIIIFIKSWGQNYYYRPICEFMTYIKLY